MEHTELVMVVPAEVLAPLLGSARFVTQDVDRIIDVIVKNHRYVERPYAEHAGEYRQIIPYAVLTGEKGFFLVKRLKAQTEKRLHGLYSLGMGGHINPTEESAADVILAGMRRELAEEVGAECPENPRCLGVINDHSAEVSNYHLGLLYRIDTSAEISVVETKKMTGRWVSAREVDEKFAELESWSQIIWEHRDKWAG